MTGFFIFKLVFHLFNGILRQAQNDNPMCHAELDSASL